MGGKTYGIIPRQGLVEPYAARAEDVLVQAPCLVAALDSDIGEEPRLK